MKKKGKARNIIFWCAVIVFFVSVSVLCVEFYGSLKSRSDFDDLRALIDEESDLAEDMDDSVTSESATSSEVLSSEKDKEQVKKELKDKTLKELDYTIPASARIIDSKHNYNVNKNMLECILETNSRRIAS